jgi:hypothetical protein
MLLGSVGIERSFKALSFSESSNQNNKETRSCIFFSVCNSVSTHKFMRKFHKKFAFHFKIFRRKLNSSKSRPTAHLRRRGRGRRDAGDAGRRVEGVVQPAAQRRRREHVHPADHLEKKYNLV